MKTIKKDGEMTRKSDVEAASLVKSGWAYCKKEEWKKTRVKPVTSKVVKKEEDEEKKQRHHSKYRERASKN